MHVSKKLMWRGILKKIWKLNRALILQICKDFIFTILHEQLSEIGLEVDKNEGLSDVVRQRLYAVPEACSSWWSRANMVGTPSCRSNIQPPNTSLPNISSISWEIDSIAIAGAAASPLPPAAATLRLIRQRRLPRRPARHQQAAALHFLFRRDHANNHARMPPRPRRRRRHRRPAPVRPAALSAGTGESELEEDHVSSGPTTGALYISS